MDEEKDGKLFGKYRKKNRTVKQAAHSSSHSRNHCLNRTTITRHCQIPRLKQIIISSRAYLASAPACCEIIEVDMFVFKVVCG